MRLSTSVILALPALAVAQQKPLKDVALDTLNEYYATAQGLVESFTNPQPKKDAVTEYMNDGAVTVFTLDNWNSILTPSVSTAVDNKPEEWMIYVTGRNKTCHGQCGPADVAWQEAVSILAEDPSAPKLGYVNCDDEEVLCGAWIAPTPSVYFFLLPQPRPDQSAAKTPLYWLSINTTTITGENMANIATDKTYLNTKEWTGAMHPIDGWPAQYGLLLPLAYFLYYIAKVPSWMMTIGISLFGRRMMASRMNPGGRPAAAAPRA